MKKIISTLFIAVISLSAVNVSAQPKTLDDLLQKLKRSELRESAEYKKREREFLQSKNRQQSLLAQAKAELRKEEQISERLEAKYSEQDKDLTKLTADLNKQMGSLRELFGILQQVAGDTRGKLEASVTSAQFPGRGKFLDALAKKMGTSTELATIEEIERVIYELQREMTESGKIVTFQADVKEPSGKSVTKAVTRVGAFNLVADGRYLDYDPEVQVIAELGRQPSGRYLSTAADISAASAGQVTRFAIDPSGGAILKRLIQKPNLRERIDQGGTVGYIIISIGIIALLIAVWRWLVLGGVGRKVNAQVSNETPSEKNPLGRVLLVSERNKSIDTESLELKLNEAILKETPALVKYVSFLKIIAVVAPLMGLLGTVVGMINTFQAITLFGAGDPQLMAGGISQALITTVLGLCVAIPMTLLHSIVNTRSKSIIHVLEEQSAGIIAAHSEKTNVK